jgi:hypothetical protein
MCRTVLVLTLLGIALLSGCATTIPAPEVTPAPGAYAALLERHVDDEGRVDYAGLARDRERLDAAYAAVAARSPDSDPGAFPRREDRLAYWINAYNLAVLVGVVELQIEASVLDVRSPFPLGLVAPSGAGFFYFTKFVFGGAAVSLHALEHDIIRRRFKEPRIHFAINCASAGCPRLDNRPYRAADLDARLDAATREFVSSPDQVRIDPASRVVSVSPILDWFREDFGDVMDFLIAHAEGEKRQRLERARAEGWTIAFFEYDWSLNARR